MTRRRLWGDVNARIAGLSRQIKTRRELEQLAEAGSVDALVDRMTEAGMPPAFERRNRMGAALESGILHVMMERQRIVARWCGRYWDAVSPVLDRDDVWSVRQLVRGAWENAPVADRIRGLVPTTRLPQRTIQELAQRKTAREVVDLLVFWGHPLGRAVDDVVSSDSPDPLALESALSLAYALQLKTAVKMADRWLASYVGQLLDIQNIWTLFSLWKKVAPTTAQDLFVSGGERTTPERMTKAMSVPTMEDLKAFVAKIVEGAEVGKMVEGGAFEETSEIIVMKLLLATWARIARREPLSTAVLITYSLRLRIEIHDLRAIVWGVVLGAPVSAILERIHTA